MEPGETLEDLYAKRLPLYRRYADCAVDCTGLEHEEVVSAVAALISKPPADGASEPS
jgi:shikimate kinase